MITEDYVSFETAKLLKEKGFNEICYLGYNKNGECFPTSNRCNSQIIQPDFCFICCPTLQMAMKWLREVHKLDIDVSIEYKNSKKVYYYSILKKTIIRNIDCLHSETNFDSYEKSAKAAIKYCLENLI